jgi:autotransporter adhesin
VKNVASGAVNSNSKDAVNGGQLYGVQQTAQSAQSAAASAQTTANSAQSAAASAQTTANSAQSAANAAQGTANQALQIGQQNTVQIQAIVNGQLGVCTVNDGALQCSVTGQAAASASGQGAVAVGAGARAIGQGAQAYGQNAVAKFAGSVAIGAGAQANADPTTAVGNNAIANGNNSVALGANTTANGNNSVALGAGSVANSDNSVSVGNAATGLQRRITNVAPGIAPTDAATMGQLDSSVSQLKQKINSTGAIAMAAANIALPQGFTRGLSVGLGNQDGQTALAVGFVAQPRPWAQVKLTAGFANGTTSVGAGLSIGW